jgi:hypothetical protein
MTQIGKYPLVDRYGKNPRRERIECDNAPLEATIRDGQLLIRVGIDTIVSVSNGNLNNPKITNPLKFAEDMVDIMFEEDSNEESFLANFLNNILDRTLESSRHVDTKENYTNE